MRAEMVQLELAIGVCLLREGTENRARGRTKRADAVLVPSAPRRPLCSYPGAFPCGMADPDCERCASRFMPRK